MSNTYMRPLTPRPPPPPPTLDLYIAFGRRPNALCQQHWLLILAPSLSSIGTYYSVRTSGSVYTHSISPHKPLNTPSIEITGKLSTIPIEAGAVVDTIARSITPQRCPLYVIEVLRELEKCGLIGEGIAKFYERMVPPSMLEWAAQEKGMREVDAVSVLVDAVAHARQLGVDDLEYDTCFF
ncbi:hypothetical protein ASPCAL14292 [Aspergillus calidoustus]|uniref:Uncharacterized protein n=1 Tax=Aspergillus calidoustus TaxID=454130 RepID=A0A0U4ZPD4_ASPCI|nr:hypothetical protein ASPCAL14292 [Aspergillus calidoustus]